MRRTAAWLLTGATTLFAQTPTASKPQGPPPIPVDRVVATVNDSAILMSELRTQAAGKIRGAESRLGRRLQPMEVVALLKAELVPMIESHAMAQAAKTLGFMTPEQVEALFLDEMKREEAEQVRDLGTWQEFSKELQRQGRTWQTYVRERRVDKMKEFAEDFAIRSRLQNQSNLFLTPRMLRETYQLEVARFVHGPRAAMVLINFEGDNASTSAAAAAELWQKEDLNGQELLARFPDAKGTTIELNSITEESRAALVTELYDFAMAGPAQRVLPPSQQGGTWRIAKIMAHDPARNGRFEDADVQNVLRDICHRGVIEELRRQATARSMQRTEFWITKELR